MLHMNFFCAQDKYLQFKAWCSALWPTDAVHIALHIWLISGQTVFLHNLKTAGKTMGSTIVLVAVKRVR